MKAKLDKIEMKVPAKPEYVSIVRLTVSGIANRMGYAYDTIEDMKVAIAEACTNVVDHAYDEGHGDINLAFTMFEDRFEMMVSDEGGKNPTLKKANGPVNASTPVQDLQEGGLGLFLIETLMDEVDIQQGNGVTIKMKKFLQRDEVAQGADGLEATVNEKG
ncbi:anti-sigma B factor RsbW [Geomicrobium sp. JCM 19039]|uniref:anti-sigma B factor RsbW n=1 Tax=Geomicrobium sp. JCM 19039 TaxID=1460636 RepID=UPI00045F32AC|nr:anti-sigma B factor RsbW [Geomicrobium sp. JCM 19039]GAK10710.1 serine-protein kinase RsbW [Geomicrobium sp. JCM 19039]